MKTITDLPDCKLTEKELQASEENYRRLVDNLIDSFIYRHNKKGIFTYVSPSITKVLGYSKKEFLAHFTTYLTDHPVNKQAAKHTRLSIQGIQQPSYGIQISLTMETR